LAIDPGVVVKFEAVDAAYGENRFRNEIVVNGTLDLRGTASQKVISTDPVL